MLKYYSGVGSRETPQNLSEYIKTLARKLYSIGYILRSGGATGFDSFIESGATNKKIYLPWPLFNNLSGPEYINITGLLQQKAEEIASKVHPNWGVLTSGAKRLHARNVFQCLGDDLKTPSKFLICWTPNGEIVGGTATSIKIALAHNIPVFNLAKEEDKVRVDRFIGY